MQVHSTSVSGGRTEVRLKGANTQKRGIGQRHAAASTLLGVFEYEPGPGAGMGLYPLGDLISEWRVASEDIVLYQCSGSEEILSRPAWLGLPPEAWIQAVYLRESDEIVLCGASFTGCDRRLPANICEGFERHGIRIPDELRG